MPRYYFDMRENGEIATDEVGLELPGLQHAEVEAARSLADMVRDLPADGPRHELAVEVRGEGGPIFKAAVIYGATCH